MTHPHQPAQEREAEPPAKEYQGVRCMCVLTGCRAGRGCPHYSTHCQKHIEWKNKPGGKQ